ncbi:MAG: hypothetical protein ACTSU0_07135, partial [Alphaproteobacteria bacterium]
MNGLTNAYLQLSALPPVGLHLLDPRPAFVTTADGRHIMWANAAAVGFFEQSKMDRLLNLTFSHLNPMVAQLARLSRQLPTDTARMEMLRVGRGTRLAPVTASCRRLNLPEGERAVLVVATAPDKSASMSLAGRAERLSDMMGSRTCLVSIMSADGRVLAASGDSDGLVQVEQEIDSLIEGAAASSDHLLTATLTVDGGSRPAGVAGFLEGGAATYLVMIGPRESAPAIAAAGAPASDEPPAQQDNAPPPPTPSATGETSTQSSFVAATTSRFIWECGLDWRITNISAALVTAVGEANGALHGYRWAEVGEALGFTLPQAEDGAWSATVDWPIAETGDTVAVDLAALAPDKNGQRGFGLIRHDEMRPDARAQTGTLADRAREQSATEPTTTTEHSGETPGAVPETPPATASPVTGETETAALTQAAPPEPSRPKTADPRDLDDQARRDIEAGTGAAVEPASTSNSPSRRPNTAPLSAPERETFRRIGQSLGSADKTDGLESSPPVAAPASAPAPVHDVSSRAAAAVLDRVPLGLMIMRDGDTLFSNRALTSMLGYEKPEALYKAGGIDAVFPGGSSYWSGRDMTGVGGRLFAARQDGGTIAVNVSMRSVTWNGASALMLALKPD